MLKTIKQFSETTAYQLLRFVSVVPNDSLFSDPPEMLNLVFSTNDEILPQQILVASQLLTNPQYG